MTPPPSTTSSTAVPASPASAPPVPPAQAAPPSPDSISPYRLQMSGGYTSLSLGNGGPTYSGGQFQASVGQAFFVHPRHSFFFNGVFRMGALSDGGGHDLSMVHFGLEGGYEVWLAPRIFSLFGFAGLGTNVFYSPQFGVEPSVTRSLNNQAAFALTAGGGFTLGHGIFVFSGGIQPNFGLSVPSETPEGAPRGYNPVGYFINAGLDLAQLVDWAGGRFPRDVSLGQFVSGIQPGFMLDTTYTLNTGSPANGENALRVFDTRADRPMFNYMKVSLDRPVDENNALGFRFDFGVGENSRVQQSRSSFSGDWYDLQQFYARLRLPVGNGLTVRGGKIAAPVGIDVIEGLLNNHVSHSWQFGIAEPFNILGVLLDYPFVPDVFTATGGIYNGWDNVLDRSSGIGGILNLGVNPASWLALSGTGMVGGENGRLRSLADFVATVKVNDTQSTAGNFDRFTIAAAYDWGREGAGAGEPESNWHSFSTTARVNFIRQIGFAQRFEVFADPQGARSGASQTLWETTSTLHVTPLPWMRLRAEYRHDQSSEPSFFRGALPANAQDTFALGAGLLF